MENARNTEASTASAQSCCAPAGKSRWQSSRNLLIGGLALAGGGAMFLGWDWLVAAGVASIIVAMAPCLVMCALGLCASRMGKKDAGTGGQAVPPKEAQTPAVDTVATAQPVVAVAANDPPAVAVEKAKSA